MLQDKCVITKIEVQKKNKDRVNVFIDGEYSFACSNQLIYTYNLKVNKSVDIEQLKEVVNEDNFLKCKNDSLKIIERSYKSEKDVYDKLIKKGYDEKNIARTIEFLKSYNFLNDDEYCRLYIKDKIKSQGKNKIKYSLVKKGISENIINEKLSEVSDMVELDSAMKIAEKKYNILIKSETDNRKIYKKLWEFLTRNGYDKEIINEILSKVIDIDSNEIITDNKSIDLDQIYELAKKRYNLILKSESDERKIYKKLSDFLLRRGYPWEAIKQVLKDVLRSEEIYE